MKLVTTPIVILILASSKGVKAQDYGSPSDANDVAMGTNAGRLIDALFMSYDKVVHPGSTSVPAKVKLGITLTKVELVDTERNMFVIHGWLDTEWHDRRLMWNEDDYNQSSIRVPNSIIWMPDISLYNSYESGSSVRVNVCNDPTIRAMIYTTGTVFLPCKFRLQATCPMDITNYPFDEQKCRVKFGSWVYNGFDVDVTNRSENAELSNYEVNAEFQLVNIHQRRRVVKYTCCPEPYPDITYLIHLKRNSDTLKALWLHPQIIFVLLSFLSFVVPCPNNQRLNYCLMVLLIFTQFSVFLIMNTPRPYDQWPVLYSCLCRTLKAILFALLSTILVSCLWHTDPIIHRRMPGFMRKLLLDCFARCCLMKKLPKTTNYVDENQENEAFQPQNVTKNENQILNRDRIKAEWKQASTILNRLLICVFVVMALSFWIRSVSDYSQPIELNGFDSFQ